MDDANNKSLIRIYNAKSETGSDTIYYIYDENIEVLYKISVSDPILVRIDIKPATYNDYTITENTIDTFCEKFKASKIYTLYIDENKNYIIKREARSSLPYKKYKKNMKSIISYNEYNTVMEQYSIWLFSRLEYILKNG